MKNVTVDLDEAVHRWARIEAAKANKSLSRWVADRLGRSPVGRDVQRGALARFLAAPDLPGIASDLVSREELYGERLFRRHERVSLRKGPKNAGQASKGHRVDRGSG